MLAKLFQRLGHLLPGNIIVEWRDRDIAAVDDFCPALVWVNASSRIESAEGCLPASHMTDGSGAESSSRAVADTGIKRRSDDSNVKGFLRVRETLGMLEMCERADAGEPPLPTSRVISL